MRSHHEFAAYLISEVPDGDAYASGDRLASRNDVLVVSRLLVEQGLGGREGHTNIELGDGDLDSDGGELTHNRGERSRDLANDEVALEANAIDGHARGLERLDKVQQGSSLRAGGFDVVVIDVKLGAGVSGAC